MQLTDMQKEALTVALDALSDWTAGGPVALGAMCVIEELLAAHNAGAQEPVAEDHECVYENGDGVCRQCVALAKQSKVFGYARRTDGYRTTGQTPEDHELCNADAPGAFALYTRPQPMTQTDAARDVLLRAKRMLEGYADSYASMERQCQMNGDEGRVSCTAVMHDIRNNMAGWIDREIARLDRAKGE